MMGEPVIKSVAGRTRVRVGSSGLKSRHLNWFYGLWGKSSNFFLIYCLES